jgi:2-polyprenyl-3-methyl-5-hydroxy-6-metoxy-1,4-benzoquinol methylase
MKSKQGFIDLVLLRLNDSLPISSYSKTYLQTICKNLAYYVAIYHNMLESVEAETGKKIKELKFIDYGGGTGLLSCYLVWQGAAFVTYVDIFEPSVKDAKCIATYLNTPANEYITGNVEQINQKADVLLSMDVIEHIYDLSSFFENVKSLNADIIQIHITGANTYNPLVKRKLEAVHLANELINKTPPIGAKPSDNYRAYFDLRAEWISKFYGDKLDAFEIKALAERTRGLVFEDISGVVNNYMLTKVMPALPSHKTNTCNPYTGNWSERLLTKADLENYTQLLGWDLKINTLGYNPYAKPLYKKFPILLMDFLARLLPKLSMFWQPLLKFTIT